MSKELNKASVEQAGGDERDFQAEGAQEVPSPVSQEYDRHLISLLRKGEALPGHQEEAADEIERLRDWNDHLNNTVLPNILNPTFLMLMKGGERLLDLCTKDGEFIGVSLNDMKDVFDWMVTHARIAPDQAALAQPSHAPELAERGTQHRFSTTEQTCRHDFAGVWWNDNGVAQTGRECRHCGFFVADVTKAQAEQAEAERPEVVAVMESNGAGGKRLAQRFPIVNVFVGDELMTVAQHERIVGALRAERDGAIKLLGQSVWQKIERLTQERDAALARVAELERQEPVALANRGLHAFWVKWTEAAAGLYGPGIKLYAAPVAQAQHSVPVAREQLERLVRILDAHNYAKDAEALMALLAAAPGKEVPQAWLDVQAERRRQVEAEGWTPEHDDLYCAAELPRAAAAYILNGANDEAPAIWPFVTKWWKPRDARSNYVRAGALILAEIERLDRAAAAGKEVGHE
ncbi:hypothetical protein MWT08_005513 [Pseudomonas aeruginosa]|uniref:hypothetical protein n=1 Tax=Pseudomonas aeruginosa TaxID=287 RepID=UPI001FF9B533|nr:hypothetical protein [Pseudomonas aeruginosa]